MDWIISMLSRLPLSVLYFAGSVFYFFSYRIFRIRTAVVVDNLTRSFPDWNEAKVNETARKFYRNYSDVLAEMVKSISMDKDELFDRVRFVNMDVLKRRLDGGQPVLLTAAHHCNLEWMILGMCGTLGFPVEAIYRPMASLRVQQFATRVCARFGGTLIDDQSVVRQIMQRRNEPRVVILAADQAPNLNDEKVWVEFLHQDTGFFLAPDTIARFVKYPVFFARMRRSSRGRYEVELKQIACPPYASDGSVVINAYIKEVEQQIYDSPQDWLWAHRRWKRKKSVYE